MSPPYYARKVPSLALPPPWGFNAPGHQENRAEAKRAVPTRIFLVRKEGFDPPRGCPHRLLRPARLPVPPLPHWYLPTILIRHQRCQVCRGGGMRTLDRGPEERLRSASVTGPLCPESSSRLLVRSLGSTPVRPSDLAPSGDHTG